MIISRNCVVCGNRFDIEIEEGTGKILTDCFHMGKIRLGIGMWGRSKMVKKADGSFVFVRCISRWKELWYRLIDLKRLLFHQYKDVEYWECSNCLPKEEKEFLKE